LLAPIPESKRSAVKAVLAEDPRPSYQDDPEREYYMEFAGYEIGFKVAETKLTVTEVNQKNK
nr:tRNA (N6-threonylcarbamoyladenosine(37)-N6)-methyltransferase TrmO [Clostridia bacterium]